MNLRRVLACTPLVLGLALPFSAHAVTTTYTGNLANDASYFELPIDVTSPTTYTFSTSSYASGGIVPDLTLFNATSGTVVDTGGANVGSSDVTLTDTLADGTYDLYLTEFPNEAIGDLTDGFLAGGDPSFTGDNCSQPGTMFLNTVSCTPTSNAYSFTVSTMAPTPEPSTLLLVFPPAAALLALARRRRLA